MKTVTQSLTGVWAFCSFKSTRKFLSFRVFLPFKAQGWSRLSVCFYQALKGYLAFILSLDPAPEIKNDELFLDSELGSFHFCTILPPMSSAVVSGYLSFKEIWICHLATFEESRQSAIPFLFFLLGAFVL